LDHRITYGEVSRLPCGAKLRGSHAGGIRWKQISGATGIWKKSHTRLSARKRPTYADQAAWAQRWSRFEYFHGRGFETASWWRTSANCDRRSAVISL